MSRIGILTFLHNGNYGSSLQAFALQRVIQNMGYEAELFIGLSGDSYEDYEEVSISIKEFPKTAESLLNNEWDKEVHFLFNEDWLGMEM